MQANFVVDDIELEAQFNLDIPTSGCHSTLSERGVPNQHPISAITGLEQELTTLKNDRDDLGDQVQQQQVDINTLKDSVATLQGNDHDLGNQVQEIQATVNQIDTKNCAHLTGAETLDSKTFTNSSFKDEFTVHGSEELGETFNISFISGTAQLSTNNGLDILSNTNFLTNPTVETDTPYEDALPNEVLSKKQMAQAIANMAVHLEKLVLMGVPEAIELTTSLAKMPIPSTTILPPEAPEDIELNTEGNGIVFKKEGLVHIKRNVSLGGSNTENIYYEARVDDMRLDNLLAQAVSVSENTMNFSIEFYWYVTAGQEISIWANAVSGTCNLNFKGVTTVAEYL